MSTESESSAEKPCKPHEYALMGPQVEPDSSYWMYCSKLHIVTIDELKAFTDDKSKPDSYFPPYPDPCTKEGAAEIKKEMEELLELSKLRDDPCALVGGPRKPISKLLNLMPPALGATLVSRFPGEQIIRTGRGMARAVESETPGLYHRHALNYLISQKNWSPPRQALIWAALDVALASALQAAWYYKWLSPRPLTARRERPIEYSNREHSGLNVLFDLPDELNPAYNLCPDGRKPGTMSGTPRHPAYPSGHSTYSGAGVELLSFFFGNQPAYPGAQPSEGTGTSTTMRPELDNMADNIGMGRLWAGIHWRSDHVNGMKLGRAVAHLVLKQLADMGIDLCAKDREHIDQCDRTQSVKNCDMTKKPPTREELEKAAKKFHDDCGPKKLQAPCPPPPAPKSLEQMIDANRGVQQGAQ
jgi:hypothetical protein